MFNSDIITESSTLFLNSHGFSLTEKSLKYGFNKSAIRVENERQSKEIGKKLGEYVSITLPENYQDYKRYLIKILSQSLIRFYENVDFGKNKIILVTGLGNDNYTADSLGIKTIEKVKIKKGNEFYRFESGLRLTSLAPNVSANTGIDSFEITKGVIDRISPSLVIAVDTLSASTFKKVGKVFQITDAGIKPGSGVGKGGHWFEEKSLGVPIVAIGVPLVVTVYNIVRHYVGSYDISDSEKRELENLYVTPKNIESLIDFASEIIASAINESAENFCFV